MFHLSDYSHFLYAESSRHPSTWDGARTHSFFSRMAVVCMYACMYRDICVCMYAAPPLNPGPLEQPKNAWCASAAALVCAARWFSATATGAGLLKGRDVAIDVALRTFVHGARAADACAGCARGGVCMSVVDARVYASSAAPLAARAEEIRMHVACLPILTFPTWLANSKISFWSIKG